MTEIMLGKPPELVVNSYFAARRFVVEEMLRYEHCYPYVIGLVLRSTKHICNVPVHHRRPRRGQLRLYAAEAAEPLDERLYLIFGQAAAHRHLFRHAVCSSGFVYLIYIVIDHFTRGAPRWAGRPPRRCCCFWAA